MTLGHHDAVERHGNLLLDKLTWQVDAVARKQRQTHHGLLLGARMKCGERSVVTRVHGLQHVAALGTAYLTHDDAVGAHAQGIGHQVADCHRALALDRCLARLQAHHMRMVRKLELSGILDCHDALAGGNLARQRVEQRGLARARTSCNRQILPQRHRTRKQLRIPKRQRSQSHELIQRAYAVRKLADSEDWSIDRHGRNHRIDAIARLEAGIDDGAALIDAPAQRRDDAIYEHANLFIVLKRMLNGV